MPKSTPILGKILIGGGTGFIGGNIANALRAIGSDVWIVSRMPGNQHITWSDINNKTLLDGTQAVINVAGQNVLDARRKWTEGFKQNVINSRVETTKVLANVIKRMKSPPKVYVTISGVGFYKPSLTAEYTEDSESGDDFMADLCRQWERASLLPPELGVRNVIIRSGVVLGQYGGIIKQIYLPFWFGLGGPIASGKQYFPWIHIEDMINLFMFAIEEDHVTGVLNGVSPQIITNYEFTKALGRALWRPTVIPLPEFVVQKLFGKERAVMMTDGQKVIPKRTLDLGFKYLYSDIDNACKHVV
ncbi:epimerase family protein SDR39U1-like [Oppia nitens]|uniref:epimerase family protein SDR39U1-like n=1 Tax=Oppia nitens TaxID=1686743 RepID=UPI0023DC7DE1|nr:epimerase family protein SDR39U1-like [Oppia nitens]